jgi:hypothetical protein
VVNADKMSHEIKNVKQDTEAGDYNSLNSIL